MMAILYEETFITKNCIFLSSHESHLTFGSISKCFGCLFRNSQMFVTWQQSSQSTSIMSSKVKTVRPL